LNVCNSETLCLSELDHIVSDEPQIDTTLVRRLIDQQFPQWAELPIRPVAQSGWDNRTFHLGEQMLVRLPSGATYAQQPLREQRWLPQLAPHLPLQIPMPLGLGLPSVAYPWHWSVYGWIEGEVASPAAIKDMPRFACDLALFLRALWRIDTTHGPAAGTENHFRGGCLLVYDQEAQDAIAQLGTRINGKAASAVWQAALNAKWNSAPVWVHGDISVGNLLATRSRLTAVIDFGLLCVGDPACDLVIAWTLFVGQSREAFNVGLSVDASTWARARGWALWKAMIVAAGLVQSNAAESESCWRVINEVLADHAAAS
jgi:aminoglycoside phosphotransferase (APT) family kinase protein